MKRMEGAVAMLELLDYRRAEASDPKFGKQIERDLMDLYIRDLDPDRGSASGTASVPEGWLSRVAFLVIGVGPYAVLFWLLWPGR